MKHHGTHCVTSRPVGSVVGIEWKRHHVGQGWWAMRGQRIAGETVWYQRADFPHDRYWVGYVGRERVAGEFGTDDEAKAAVEAGL